MHRILDSFGIKSAGKETVCLKDRDHRLYLYISPEHDGSGRVAGVFLSSFPNCEGFPVHSTVIDPTVWRTPEGVGVGRSKEQVLRAYGAPPSSPEIALKDLTTLIAGTSEVKHLTPIGSSSLLYNCAPSDAPGCSTDNRATQFGLSDGKVVWIDISDSE
jgi:hypothetical protein